MKPFEGEVPRCVNIDSPWLAPFDGSLKATGLNNTSPHENMDSRVHLKKLRKQIGPLQELLFAAKQYSVLCIFQALDAAGKDGTIREVFSELDPAGIRVAAFKRPTRVELAHDFLWRTTLQLPRRGELCIFNRSYYEEVLSVKVHPEFLGAQYPGGIPDLQTLWPARYQAIREHERHLATANTLILKFWLHVSPQEQAQRFLDRINEEDKRWKFSTRDVVEASFRPAYDEAVLQMLNETSRPWAPWFAIPADHKSFMRQQVAKIVHQALDALPMEYPQSDFRDSTKMAEISKQLEQEIKKGAN